MITRVFKAFGLVVAIHTDAPDIFDLLQPQLPIFPEEAAASATPDLHYHVKVPAGGGVSVLRGRRTLATVQDVPAASLHLVSDLQSAMARQAKGYTFVHSGVVAIDDTAVLFPANSYAGKSTLVAALLRAGATYGSDEFAVIDTSGHVHPYSRHLALRTSHRPKRVPVGDLGGRVLTNGLHVGAIVFTEFKDGAQLDLAPLSAGEVVLRLLRHCLGVRGRPTETMTSLRAVARDAAGFASLRGDADETARLLIARAKAGWKEP